MDRGEIKRWEGKQEEPLSGEFDWFPTPAAENPVHLSAFATEVVCGDFSNQDVEIATSYAQGPSICDLC